MFLLRSIYNFVNPSVCQVENLKRLENLNAELDAVIEQESNTKIPFQNEIERKKEENEQSLLSCFKKVGIITSIKSNHGIIDNTHMFNINKVAKNLEDLKVGYKVEYLAYMPEGEDSNLIICKITDILNYSWDQSSQAEIEEALNELRDSNPICFNKHERNIMGTIIDRREHFIKVETDADPEFEIDLESTSIEFVPQFGDRIVLHCIVQSDEQYVDGKGEILECKNITSVRSKIFKGFITRIEENWGVIESVCYFMFDVLDIGYKPNKGDRVTSEAIENDAMAAFNFRSIKVSLMEKSANDTQMNGKNLAQNELFENKKGITVTDKIKFNFDKLYDTETKDINITNTGTVVTEFIKYTVNTSFANSQLRVKGLSRTKQNLVPLQPGESITFQINGKAKHFGLSSEILELHFKEFKIARSIEIEVGGDENCENIDNNVHNNNKRVGSNSYKQKSYNAKIKWSNLQTRSTIPGVTTNARPRFVKQKIPTYEVPERLKMGVLNADDNLELQTAVENICSSLRDNLQRENYAQRFSALLHIEEIERFIQMRQYDRDRAHFIKDGEYLRLDIENLAEKRPSLMLGDTVHATNPWSEQENKQSFQGFIHKVLHNRILIKFNPSFHSKYNGEDYRLEFFFSRSSFRKMHFAVQNIQSHMGHEFLFPTKIINNKIKQWNVELNEDYELVDQTSLNKVNWYNPNLNYVQKIAINNVLKGEARPMPYIIFGPPGTGKTITLIEAVLQLFKSCPNTRMLIGTPTNSAADLIATRLIESKALIPGDFIRLVGQNFVEKDLIPEHLKAYCATADIAIDDTSKDQMIVTESGLKLKCQSRFLGSHRIIIGTCVTLGTLLYMGYSKSHFSHVLIDEAGQCMEPEIMTVIKQVDCNGGQIILAGDPLQLGPIVLHKYAAEKGLETSFLSRLLTRSPYAKDKIRYKDTGYNPQLLTKLLYNYRSLPSILNCFNGLFYDSELRPKIEEHNSYEANLLKSLENIFIQNYSDRKINHGLMFYGIRGLNRQDSDSPSWYNGEEAGQLYLFSLKLFKEGVEPSNIGIITPYQKQVKKIRQLFLASDISVLPKIGTVEEFQGQERQIILISTVRSTKSFIQTDLKFTLGFVQSSKRMNVAISRARALLVIFGNPHILALDPCWENLIRYCVVNKAYSGCDLPLTFDNFEDCK